MRSLVAVLRQHPEISRFGSGLTVLFFIYLMVLLRIIDFADEATTLHFHMYRMGQHVDGWKACVVQLVIIFSGIAIASGIYDNLRRQYLGAFSRRTPSAPSRSRKNLTESGTL